VDRIFDEFTRGFGRWPLGRRAFEVEPLLRYETSLGVSAPIVDVIEKETEYQISAELPGLDEKDVEVSVVDDMLTIKGEKKLEKEEKAKTITSPNAVTVPSSAHSSCLRAWMPKRSRQISRRAF
jgi:HSP20 family protein